MLAGLASQQPDEWPEQSFLGSVGAPMSPSSISRPVAYYSDAVASIAVDSGSIESSYAGGSGGALAVVAI